MVQLRHITVENFRSIRGRIDVPLDAPVVLVHGNNGAGKTSLLSAIELALTGHIPSLSRVDRNYRQHLVNKSEDTCSLGMSIADGGLLRDSRITVSNNGINGVETLSPSESRFYSERCYLAQSTLSRLLEIYEDKKLGLSSPLTRFVKDMLGLDYLDSLIDGLHDAGHKSRLKKAVPIYDETISEIERLESKVSRFQNQAKELKLSIDSERQKVIKNLSEMKVNFEATDNVEVLIEKMMSVVNQNEIDRFSFLRRESGALQRQWDELDSPSVELEASLKEDEKSISLKIEDWTKSCLPAILSFIQKSSDLLGLPVLSKDRNYLSQVESHLNLIDKEMVQAKKQIEKNYIDNERIISLNKNRESLNAALEEVNQEIIGYSSQSGRFAQLLSEISNHTNSEECPVCNRDYSEKDDSLSLQDHIKLKVEELTNAANRLEKLNKDRRLKQNEIANLEFQISQAESALPEPSYLKDLEERFEILTDLKREFSSLIEFATVGDSLFSQRQSVLSELSDLSSANFKLQSIRDGVAEQLRNVGLRKLAEDEPTGSGLARLKEFISRNQDRFTLIEKSKNYVLSIAEGINSAERRLFESINLVKQFEAERDNLEAKIENANKLVKDARALTKKAIDVRSDIVRRVFNESLNNIWRELFIRLAPDEPFVPAFAIPNAGTGKVEAKLETIHRSGGSGGNPRTMLSSGNLNTAALTLFLGLHLSAPAELPWLVIDDPVQSMDEVHISQFAALLRTLSKFHGRQTVIAVHEKALFDYLKLELSPAFEGDKLITVELEKDFEGFTKAECNTVNWHKDSAFAA